MVVEKRSAGKWLRQGKGKWTRQGDKEARKWKKDTILTKRTQLSIDNKGLDVL
jgi:hypothetical protein